MPVQTVETLPNGLTMHYFRGGDQPICSLSVIFPGGAAEHDEAAGRMAVNLLTEGTKLNGKSKNQNYNRKPQWLSCRRCG